MGVQHVHDAEQGADFDVGERFFISSCTYCSRSAETFAIFA
jgi:hypothetical protein